MNYASTHGSHFDALADISGWGPLVLTVLPIVFLMLWVILLLIRMAVRHVDLLSTEPAIGEVISVKGTVVFVNNVPEHAVKMRVKSRNRITECRVLADLGPKIGDSYNIRI